MNYAETPNWEISIDQYVRGTWDVLVQPRGLVPFLVRIGEYHSSAQAKMVAEALRTFLKATDTEEYND